MRLYSIEGLSLLLGGAEVLAIPSLEIDKGERLALMGPNGSGKTSLLKILASLLSPTEGIVRFGGLPLHSIGILSRRIVYLHQHPYIMAGSVSYNVEFGARSRGLPASAAADHAAAAMRLLGLDGFGRRGHRALSGGEAQRVALARAIASGSDVLLLDEPTASADALSRELIAKAIGAKAESGATIVLATHDEALVRALDARMIELQGGKIAEGAVR
ncbi:MAG: energy-coupling factor ABC transporter ATP-binding protein [Rectinemataceae bacterium]|jgi:ABC-type multidrug transport system ATPase subunit